MRFSTAIATFVPILAVSAANHQVLVGEGGLTYTPSSLQAQTGDTVNFIFQAGDHSVTQSTFANPCTKLAGGIDSGLRSVTAGTTPLPQFSVAVAENTPLFFFCSQTNHCKEGMVFALNPTATQTFAEFQAKAEAS
jgi:plastocyanin